MATRIKTHPGGFIQRNYIDRVEGLNISSLAEAVGVDRGTVSRLVNEKSDLTPEMAVKLSEVLGRTPDSWLNMQTAHTLSKLLSKKEERLVNWSPARRLNKEGLWVIAKQPKRKPRAKAGDAVAA